MEKDYLKELRILFLENREYIHNANGAINSHYYLLHERVKDIRLTACDENTVREVGEYKPDLIILNLSRTGESGVQAYREICEKCNIPTVAIIESGQCIWLEELMNTQIETFIKLPQSDEAFLEQLHETARRLFNREMVKQQFEIFMSILNALPNFLLITDKKRIDYLNSPFLKFLGYTETEDMARDGKTLDDFLLPKPQAFYVGRVFEEWIADLIAHPDLEFVVYMRGKEPLVREYNSYVVLCRHIPQIDRYMLIFNDVTLIETVKSLYHDLSVKDSLTRIYNREKFGEELNKEIERAKRYKHKLTLIMLDIDDFKQVNDRFGHLAGDRVLIEFVQTIRECIRTVDVFARYGGEEFVLLLPETPIENAYGVAERLRTRVSQRIFDSIEKLSCSFGVAEYNSGESGDSFINRADELLYRAKSGGKNRVEIDRSELR